MSPVSISAAVSVPVAVGVPVVRVLDSVTAPLAASVVAVITGVSLVPLMVTVTTWVRVTPCASVTVAIKFSVITALSASPLESVGFRAKFHAPSVFTEKLP